MSSRLVRKNHLLKNKILEWYPAPGKYPTPIPDFFIVRRDEPSDFERYLYNPMILLQLQGRKLSVLGTEEYSYGEYQYMVSTVSVSAYSKITEASPKNPFLALSLELDSQIIMQLLSIDDEHVKSNEQNDRLWFVGDTDLLLMDAFLRLTLLLEQSPKKRTILSNMIKKEIHYLLLISPIGAQMRDIATKGTHYNKIAEAVNLLQKNYQEKLYVHELANQVNISPSAFFRYFKKVTTLSPIQYQKQLRLHEAQRLMLSEGYDAQSACYAVGYESPTQFNREYKKLFGVPPKTSVKKIFHA